MNRRIIFLKKIINRFEKDMEMLDRDILFKSKFYKKDREMFESSLTLTEFRKYIKFSRDEKEAKFYLKLLSNY